MIPVLRVNIMMFKVQVGLGVLYLPIGGHTIGSKAVRQHVQIDPIILDH